MLNIHGGASLSYIYSGLGSDHELYADWLIK